MTPAAARELRALVACEVFEVRWWPLFAASLGPSLHDPDWQRRVQGACRRQAQASLARASWFTAAIAWPTFVVVVRRRLAGWFQSVAGGGGGPPPPADSSSRLRLVPATGCGLLSLRGPS